MAIHTIIETSADILDDGGGSVWFFKLISGLKMKRWKIKTLSAATISKVILSQNVVSTPKVFALVIKSKIPEGMIRIKPRLDHGSKCCDKPSTGSFFEKPSRRRSNIKAAPTSKAIPAICTISNAGYSQRDWRMPVAQDVFSNQLNQSDEADCTVNVIRIFCHPQKYALHAFRFLWFYEGTQLSLLQFPF